jgi:hypothetical protein
VGSASAMPLDKDLKILMGDAHPTFNYAQVLSISTNISQIVLI